MSVAQPCQVTFSGTAMIVKPDPPLSTRGYQYQIDIEAGAVNDYYPEEWFAGWPNKTGPAHPQLYSLAATPTANLPDHDMPADDSCIDLMLTLKVELTQCKATLPNVPP